MKWHHQHVVKKVALFVLAILLDCFAVGFFSLSIVYDKGVGIFICVIMLLYAGLLTYASFKQLSEALEQKKIAVAFDLLKDLKYLDKYGTNDDIVGSFEQQKCDPLYQDEKIIITNDFVSLHGNKKVFLIDGVLDVVAFVSKANGVIEWVKLIILYYDGKKYEVVFRRSPMRLRMKEIANSVNRAANIIAIKSENYRRYPFFKLND